MDDTKMPMILDHLALEELKELEDSGSFQNLVVELISMFLSSTPQQIDTMLLAARAGEYTRVRKIAHTMKSGAAHLGAHRFAKCCQDLETSKDLNEDTLKARVAEIQTHFDEVRHEFERELQLHSRPSTGGK